MHPERSGDSSPSTPRLCVSARVLYGEHQSDGLLTVVLLLIALEPKRESALRELRHVRSLAPTHSSIADESVAVFFVETRMNLGSIPEREILPVRFR